MYECEAMAWKVYGLNGHEQKETHRPSSAINMDSEDNPWKRKIVLEVLNYDLTGTHEYAIVKIIAPSKYDCETEFSGQLSDGVFENYQVEKIEPIDDEEIKIKKDQFEQGFVYRNDEAFNDGNDPYRVCYVPELSNSLYTRQSFLDLADNDPKIAELIYQFCDWASPETVLEDLLTNNEIIECPKCNHLILIGDDENAVCSHCGEKIHIPNPYI